MSGALALAAGCSSEDPAAAKGQLMLVIKTDMSVPKDVSAVRIEVIASGVVRHRSTYTVGPGADVRLPGTLAIVAGKDPSIPVKIRVIAFSGQEPKVLREAITTVPSDRIASLPMTISWLCWNEPTALPPPETEDFPDAETSCDPGDTCSAGSCVAGQIESASLPTFRPEEVFGGASGPGAVGTCFDTLACFDPGALVPVDLSDCTIAEPAGGTDAFNVGLVLPPGGQGICNASTCLVALDEASGEGWSIPTPGRVALPPAVCQKILDGEVLAVATSDSCDKKTPAIPTCGPWSSVTAMSGTFDGGAAFDAPDPCFRTVGNDGVHCGSELGTDPLTLYHCVDGATFASEVCGSSCVVNAGDDACTAVSPFGGPCTDTAGCAAGLLCVEQTSTALGGEGAPNGICTVECTNDPSICNGLAVPAPCIELGTRDFCLESCTIGDPPAAKCGGRTDVACAPVTLSASTLQATVCVPTCGSDADCPTQRCNLATGFCTSAPSGSGTDVVLSECFELDGGVNSCGSKLCQQFKDGSTGATIGACSGRCRLGSATGCGNYGACTMPAVKGASDGDLGFCSELCNDACGCSNPSFLCMMFNDPALEQKFGSAGYCAPYWEVGGGC